MRGKLPVDLNEIARQRITPAHAGKTWISLYFPLQNWDHPRACGENRPSELPFFLKLGSPPRMRGKLGEMHENFGQDRITPAHAGKTVCTPVPRSAGRDHPRACGENIEQRLAKLEARGSPPRMRGKHIRFWTVRRIAVDHPRACGENCVNLDNLRRIPGSPPRMRGKRVRGSQNLQERRITPAHAGKTPCLIYMCRDNEDHPRACGENLQSDCCTAAERGSPPRMRGKHTVYFMSSDKPRITPAHAGKTISFRFMLSVCQDHPRACGENLSFRFAFIAI